MKKVGLLGFGIGYSLSPAMHNAAFADHELPWHYHLLDVSPETLQGALSMLRQDPWMGANVTIPFKEAVLPYLDQLSPAAESIGAVNTIVRRKGRLIGENTDYAGFRQDLETLGWLENPGKVLIFGAGGAARAAALALLQESCPVSLLARTPSRAEKFFSSLEPALQSKLDLLPLNPESVRKAAAHAVLVVNATPLGGAALPTENPWPEVVQPPPSARFYDLTYNPPVTPFLQYARFSGLPASGGLGMLVAQGALSFQLWTGQAPNLILLRAAALLELEEYHASISDSR